MYFRNILTEFLWTHFIKDKLESFLKSETTPRNILITIPESLNFFDFPVLKQFLEEFGDFEILMFNPSNLITWIKDIKMNRIIFNNNIKNLENIYRPYIKNFFMIILEENEVLTYNQIFYLIKIVLKHIERKSFFGLNIEKYQNYFKLNTLIKITANIEKFLNLLDIEEYLLNLDNFYFSQEFINILLTYLTREELFILNSHYIQYIEDFFNLDIKFNLKIDKSALILYLIGLPCEINSEKFIEAEMWALYLVKYKLAEILKFPHGEDSKLKIWYIKPTYLWIYIKNQIIIGNNSWINEVLYTNHFPFDQRITNDFNIRKSDFNDEYENYFWIKLLIHSLGIENLEELSMFPRKLIHIYGLKIKNISKINNIKEFIKITSIQREKLKILLNILKIDDKFYSKIFKKIPVNTYKPNFLDNTMNIELSDRDIFDKFPELLLFKLLSWKNATQLEDYLFTTLTNESIELYDLLKYLMIIRYYKIIFLNLDIQLEIINIPFNDFIRMLENFTTYRIWNKINEDRYILREYFRKFSKSWEYDYYFLDSSHEYFNSLDLLHNILHYYEINDLNLKISDYFSIPCKIITEYLLFDSDIFKTRNELISKLKNKKTFLIVIDGLSYSIAKKMDYEKAIYELFPVKISGITKTKEQVKEIWEILKKSEKDLLIGCDIKVSKNQLFEGFIDDLNDYVISHGYFELFQDNRNTILEGLDESKFYFLYISNFERLNERISDEALILEKYNQILRRVFIDLRDVLEKDPTFEIYITSDHGSLYVKENLTYETLFTSLLKDTKEIKLTRMNSTRAYFLEDPSQAKINSSLKYLLSISIRNKSERKNRPFLSLIPEILLKSKSKGLSKYDHSGISLDENIVPWIKIKKL